MTVKIDLKTDTGESLNGFYDEPDDIIEEDREVKEADKMGFSPYEGGETFYYFIKHLALPGIVVLLLPLLFIFGIFENSFIGILGYFFSFIAAILLLSVGREFLRGFRYKIKKGVIYLPGPYVFRRQADEYTTSINDITEPIYKIGFVGDIMKMNDYNLRFHPDVKKFFEDTHMIIGNLEGVFSEKCPILKQAHTEKILEELEEIFPKEKKEKKWLLSLSNNHSEDFSSKMFDETLRTIQKNPIFDVYGRKDVSSIHTDNNDLLISCATQWSNQKTWHYTFKYNKPIAKNKKNTGDDDYIFSFLQNYRFNILYPHWGFENEKYVRTRFQDDAKALLTGIEKEPKWLKKFYSKKRKVYANQEYKWDLIFAHHPHVLQPIMKVRDDIKIGNKSIPYCKLVVFSAGNFTSGANIIRKKKHISGIIMKCEIGPLEGYNRKLAIGKMEWRRTKNFKTRIEDERAKLVCIDNEKYRTYNKPFLLNGLFFFIVFLAIYLINLFF